VSDSAYRVLDTDTLPAYLATLEEVRTVLDGPPAAWQVREVGDGNLNLVFIVEGRAGSVCVKQALPYVRVAGPGWPMSPQRAYFEQAYFRSVAPYVGAAVPKIHHYDPQLQCIVMERLSPHIILRQGLIAGRRYPRVARDIGEYVARACFFTSDLARPFEQKMEGIALFAHNQPLLRITVDLIFAEPYFAAQRNRHTSPQLDEAARTLRLDGAVKAAAAGFGHKFLSCPQALIHGDLHSGSVMVTATDSRVIDPEFAFYGPIGFDLGAFFANLLLSWYSQPGHAADADDRTAYRDWILEQARVFWTAFHDRFVTLWSEAGEGDAFSKRIFGERGDETALARARADFMKSLFADMLGFGACKMIRRILGFAHVLDLDGIADTSMRARCESAALAMATTLLKAPAQFRSIDDVIDAVARQGAVTRASGSRRSPRRGHP
jgi:5-methylthioribose kinase